MGWKLRWRRSTKVGPVRITQTLSGTSFSLGIPGMRYTLRADGKRQITLGIPGTGLSCTNVLDDKTAQPKSISQNKTQLQKQQAPVQINSQQAQGKPWWLP